MSCHHQPPAQQTRPCQEHRLYPATPPGLSQKSSCPRPSDHRDGHSQRLKPTWRDLGGGVTAFVTLLDANPAQTHPAGPREAKASAVASLQQEFNHLLKAAISHFTLTGYFWPPPNIFLLAPGTQQSVPYTPLPILQSYRGSCKGKKENGEVGVNKTDKRAAI